MIDPTVVVVFDQFGRFGVEASRRIDQRLADEARQLGGVSPQPDPRAKERQPGDDNGRVGPSSSLPQTFRKRRSVTPEPIAETTTAAPKRIATSAGKERVLLF